MKNIIKKHTLERSKFSFHLFFLKNCKNNHGALVGITMVKGTSVDEFFYFCLILELSKNTQSIAELCRRHLKACIRSWN